MKSSALLSLVLAAGADAGSAASRDHPVTKIITLLKGLKETAITEGKAEQVSYEKFQYWCSTSTADLKAAIVTEKETIEELEDVMAGKKKVIETLANKITELEEQLTELQASAKSAKDNRKADADVYSKANKDVADTIKAVNACIAALSGAEGKTESLLQAQRSVKQLISLISTSSSETELSTLKEFSAARPDQLAEGDLAEHTDKYDFKSENVIELLKQLKLKFEDDQTALTTAETAAINAYELSKAARDNTIKAAQDAKDKTVAEKKGNEADLADADKKHKDTSADLEADSATLAQTTESCHTKANEWERRSTTRSGEIAAIDAAVKILAKATGVRTEAPGNPVPPPSPVFFQVAKSEDPKEKAVALLRAAAKDVHSKALERLAFEVQAHLNGPFDQVNNMIQKMIFRLKDEQKSEDEHKLWCDQELEKTNTMKDHKDDKIKDLKTEIGVQKAEVSKLTNDIEDANKMISDIKAFQKEATEVRNTGKQENKIAIQDAQDAQKAITNAISVLVKFYKDSGSIKKESWESLVQKPMELGDKPETWDSGYTAVSDPKKQPEGIVTVMETVSADFSKMEADTRSQEQVDQKEYEDAMKDNEIEKARRTKDVEMKTAERDRRNDKINTLSNQNKDTGAELEKTEQYLEDLKPACVDGDSSYEDRKKARKKEIKALGEAQVTLQNAFAEKPKSFLQIRRQ